MEDKLLTCVQCGNQFILSAKEREKLMARGFDLPKRCLDCRKRKYRYFQEEDEEWGKKRKKRHTRRERDRIFEKVTP